MGKIKAFFRNKWVGFTLASLLYTLWFVVWTGNLWLLLGLVVIFDLYISKFFYRYVWCHNVRLCQRSKPVPVQNGVGAADPLHILPQLQASAYIGIHRFGIGFKASLQKSRCHIAAPHRHHRHHAAAPQCPQRPFHIPDIMSSYRNPLFVTVLYSHTFSIFHFLLSAPVM